MKDKEAGDFYTGMKANDFAEVIKKHNDLLEGLTRHELCHLALAYVMLKQGEGFDADENTLEKAVMALY